ncbi:hypothetical protein Rhe02_53060 [Rhizocola hellebori]|uniref:Uncharacterized protein n=2 Tax=Rhizocola hellebori TaxID=1392758 RepID=A0A8J3VHB8_9ACTN|nr:hypothetical protein Rhe02_53060 [Rhizocola hellebori]
MLLERQVEVDRLPFDVGDDALGQPRTGPAHQRPALFDHAHDGESSGMSSGEKPQSALNLRLTLAVFGLLCTITLIVLAFLYGNLALAVVGCVLLAVTITDLVAIQIRRRRRRKREPGVSHSIFE